MKSIYNICNENITNSLHSLYEASILDIEDTLDSGENTVRKHLCIGSKFQFGDGAGDANGSHVKSKYVGAVKELFDWKELKKYLKSIDYLNSYNKYSSIQTTLKSKFDLLVSYIMSLVYEKNIEGDWENLDRDIEFEKFLEEAINKLSTKHVYVACRCATWRSNTSYIYIYLLSKPHKGNRDIIMDDHLCSIALKKI